MTMRCVSLIRSAWRIDVHGHRPQCSGDQSRRGKIVSGDDGDVLPSVDSVADRTGRNPSAEDRLPEDLSVIRIQGPEPPVQFAEEDDVPCCSQDGAVCRNFSQRPPLNLTRSHVYFRETVQVIEIGARTRDTPSPLRRRRLAVYCRRSRSHVETIVDVRNK